MQPITIQERLEHVAAAQKSIATGITWLCDNMQNEFKHQMGNAPNSEFVIDPNGKVVIARGWSNPTQLRSDLADLVGEVSPATRINDIDVRFTPPPLGAPIGLVPRVQISSAMRPLVSRPQLSVALDSDPHYVKLRAEADSQFWDTGIGLLYLGFHMDPVHHVHWNNLAAPVEYEIETVDGVTISAKQGRAPKFDHPSDMDPREFLLGIEWDKTVADWDKAKELPIRVTMRYFACSDDDGWCKPFTQKYDLFLQIDRDGGGATRRWRDRN